MNRIAEILRAADEIISLSPRSCINDSCVASCCQNFNASGGKILHGIGSGIYLAANPSQKEVFDKIHIDWRNQSRYQEKDTIRAALYYLKRGRDVVLRSSFTSEPNCRRFAMLATDRGCWNMTEFEKALFYFGIGSNLWSTEHQDFKRSIKKTIIWTDALDA